MAKHKKKDKQKVEEVDGSTIDDLSTVDLPASEQVDKTPVWKAIVLSITTLVLVNVIGLFLIIIFQKGLGVDKYVPSILVSLIATFIGYIGIIYLLFYRKDTAHGFLRYFIDKISIKRPTWQSVVMAITTTVFIYTLISIIEETILIKLFPTNDVMNATTTSVRSTGSWVWLTGWIIPVIIAPILEETVFRGVIGTFFDVLNGNHKILYIITESLIFGLLHLQFTGSTFAIVNSVVSPIISGAIFGIIYLKTKNLTNSIIAHGAYNFIVTLLITIVTMSA